MTAQTFAQVHKDGPTPGDVHVPQPMGGKKKKPKAKDARDKDYEHAESFAEVHARKGYNPDQDRDEDGKWSSGGGSGGSNSEDDDHSQQMERESFISSSVVNHPDHKAVNAKLSAASKAVNEARPKFRAGEMSAKDFTALQATERALHNEYGDVESRLLEEGAAKYKPKAKGDDGGKQGELFRKGVLSVEILKSSEDEQRLVFGIASVIEENGKPVIDWQSDIILPATIQKAAHRYVSEARVGKMFHDGKPVAEIVESMVATKESLTAFLKAFKLPVPDQFPRLGWWVVYKVHDDVAWELVKKGVLKAFSIGGKATRRKVD